MTPRDRPPLDRRDAARGVSLAQLRGEADERGRDLALLMRTVAVEAVRLLRAGRWHDAAAMSARARGWARTAALWRRAAGATSRPVVLTLRERAWDAECGFLEPWRGAIPSAHDRARSWRASR